MPLIIDLSKNANDRVLVAYVFLLIPLMLIGFGFARRKLFVPHHKLVMTIITIANWFLIHFPDSSRHASLRRKPANRSSSSLQSTP
jgi:hypothetical protein